jgi:hypothetical protein
VTRLARTSTWAGLVRLLIVVLAGLLLGIGAFWIVSAVTQPRRTTPVFDPPVIAGQQLWGACAGGFYARHGDTVVEMRSGEVTPWQDGMLWRGLAARPGRSGPI